MANQALGLAERLNLTPIRKTVKPVKPWVWLPSGWWPMPLRALGPGSDAIEPPWPHLLISCGRRSVPYSLYVGGQAGKDCFRVHIQDPLCSLRHFDLVAAPEHDGISGDNVMQTLGAPHRVTRQVLTDAAARAPDELTELRRPLLCVLIGGDSRTHKLPPELMVRIAKQLRSLMDREGIGLAVTPSRRTGAENQAILAEALTGTDAYIWDFQGDNPYFAMLGLADYIIVTSDSVSMVSEAMSTGKPVYVIDLEGGSKRFDAFHNVARARGYCRPFDGELAHWQSPTLDETGRIAAEVARRMGLPPPD